MIILTIVLVILKALGLINFSWLWVFAPLWIPSALALIITLVGFIITGGIIFFDR